MSLSDRLARIENAAHRRRRPTGPPVVCVIADEEAASVPNLRERGVWTESEVAAHQSELAAQGEDWQPILVRLDAEDVNL